MNPDLVLMVVGFRLPPQADYQGPTRSDSVCTITSDLLILGQSTFVCEKAGKKPIGFQMMRDDHLSGVWISLQLARRLPCLLCE